MHKIQIAASFLDENKRHKVYIIVTKKIYAHLNFPKNGYNFLFINKIVYNILT